MKILLLTDSNSPHTIRWAKSIHRAGKSVSIYSIHKLDYKLYSDTPDIGLYSLNVPREIQNKNETSFSKGTYFRAVKKIRQVIKEFNPDIVHAHYASSYGLLGALSGFHPFIISMWGGDIFSFPNFTILHRSALKFSLSRADKILSTSFVMKKEAMKYTDKDINVIPFGIDTDRFYPKIFNGSKNKNEIIIGTIKTLEKRYGIEYLIKGFSLVKEKFPQLSLKLLIVGGGSELKNLQSLVNDFHIDNVTRFTGFINHDAIQDYYDMLDIYVAVSLQESFGVAVLEASACEKPVVVSNVGGLPEVVDDGKTGFIVAAANPEELADALSKLICDYELRMEMGKMGRNKVLKEYDWKESVNKMISVYNNLVN